MSKTTFSASMTALRAAGLTASGRVCLTADVANPDADRRQRHDWTRLPEVRAGARFALVYDEERTVSLLPLKGRMLHAGSPLFLAMVPHLARAEPTLAEVLDDAGFDAGEVLECLLGSGALTMLGVEAALRRLAAARDAK